MRDWYRFSFLAATLLASYAGYAGDFEISGAWTRASAPGQDAAAVDMIITSTQAATLVGVSSPIAKSVELHNMSHEGGMMKMREVKAIELPPGTPVNFGESGYHLMLVGLKTPLKVGETVPVTLSIKAASPLIVKIDAKVEVKALTAPKPSKNDGNHHRGMH